MAGKWGWHRFGSAKFQMQRLQHALHEAANSISQECMQRKRQHRYSTRAEWALPTEVYYVVASAEGY